MTHTKVAYLKEKKIHKKNNKTVIVLESCVSLLYNYL